MMKKMELNNPAGTLPLYYLKRCPRCQGDLYRRDDYTGWYLTCLQCGRSFDGDQRKAKEIIASGQAFSRSTRAA
jgi:ribosomal protein L37AE/L43A